MEKCTFFPSGFNLIGGISILSGGLIKVDCSFFSRHPSGLRYHCHFLWMFEQLQNCSRVNRIGAFFLQWERREIMN